MTVQCTQNDLNKTLYIQKKVSDASRKWLHIDATNIPFGRLAVVIANALQGKWKVSYNDFWDQGDFVVVTNVEKMIWTWNKGVQKIYHTYSWYKGHVKEIALKDLMKKDPLKVLRYAVRGMLPKNKLRDPRMKRMKSFVWSSDKYDYMKPITITL